MKKICLILVLCVVFSVGCNHKTGELYPVKLQGKFRTVGSEPFTDFVFSATNGKDYMIHAQSVEACKNIQYKDTLQIEGMASELHAYSKKIDRNSTTYFLRVNKIYIDGNPEPLVINDK